MKVFKYFSLILFSIFVTNMTVLASNSTYVNLNELKVSNDNKEYNQITEYNNLDSFLEDYNNGKLSDIYITNFLYDGVSTVKSPDLDDFIESNSNDTKIKELEIRVININTTGNIKLTGETIGTMIAVNTNNVKGDINIILNDVKIDTDNKKAPAIYVYNKETTYTGCKVTIKTVENTKNYIEGGKLKKVSLVGSDKLDKYVSYYSGDLLENYTNYSSYYGIYSSSEIDDILFATVKADTEDLSEGDPYYFYKASGAISSDIDLYFEGNGYLNVISKNKEGIETKGNLTLSGGTGDYEIYAQDDCLNTTTANSAGTNIRNDIVIDVNSLLAIVDDDGDEGDAIDSNGKLTINGGNIFAFAHSNSQDSGLDSESGTYINGGKIIATGNMADAISNESKQKCIYVTFDKKIEEGTILVIKNQDGEIITAFKTNKTISSLFYSDENLDFDSFKIYYGESIDGEEENGLYNSINTYKVGDEVSYKEVNTENNKTLQNNFQKNSISDLLLKVLIGEVILLIITLFIWVFNIKKQAQIQ